MPNSLLEVVGNTCSTEVLEPSSRRLLRYLDHHQDGCRLRSPPRPRLPPHPALREGRRRELPRDQTSLILRTSAGFYSCPHRTPYLDSQNTTFNQRWMRLLWRGVLERQLGESRFSIRLRALRLPKTREFRRHPQLLGARPVSLPLAGY